MTDLSSIGFKQSNNEETEKSTYSKIESEIGKAGADILRSENEQSNYGSHFNIPEALYIPPNPIDETNKRLGSLHSTLKEESSKNSNSAKIWNKKMFFISIFALLISISALIVSAIFSILAFNSSNESSRKLETLIMEQNRLLEENVDLNKSLKNNLNNKLINLSVETESMTK